MKKLILICAAILGLIALPALAQDATTQTPDHQDTNAKTKKAMKKAANKTQDTASAAKDTVTGHKRLDLNSATKDELAALPGMTTDDAQKIIDNRPYRGKNDLVKKNVVSADEYAKIKDDIVAKKSTAAKAEGNAGSTKGKHKKPSAAVTAGPSM
jgi:competence protein ComEA